MKYSTKERAYLVEIGRRVRARRTELGLSMTGLGRRVGVSHVQIRRVELGLHAPTIVMLAAIASALDVPVEALLPPANR